MKYPHTATIYAYSQITGKPATYTKGASFSCQAEQSPRRLQTATGAVTAADTMVFCSLKDGVATKKKDRLVINKGSGITDIVDVVKPEPAGRKCEIFATLNLQVKFDASGAML